jgi:hypothetical protein
VRTGQVQQGPADAGPCCSGDARELGRRERPDGQGEPRFAVDVLLPVRLRIRDAGDAGAPDAAASDAEIADVVDTSYPLGASYFVGCNA